jgi:glycosyltransferase involved in cell wall biosynthesis
MKTLLAFSTLPREGPSVRPRVLAYEAALAERGIRLKLAPFLTSGGFRGFYSTRVAARTRKAAYGVLGYLRRISHLATAERADGILIHREIVPRGNPRLVRTLAKKGLRIAYDLDDAIWLSPRDFVEKGETSERRMSRLKDPAEIDDLMRAADVVLAGNEMIAGHARNFCDDVRVQPTPIDTDRFRPLLKGPRDLPVVGWVGSPTAAYCVKMIVPALAAAARRIPFRLRLVGAGEPIEVEGVPVESVDWSLATEADEFAGLDIGLYPLPDNEWTRGKCGMKALSYMACGVPAIVSPVGVNREIVRHGETGCLAGTPEAWTEYIVSYLSRPALRAAHGAAGRERVVAGWSVGALANSFVDTMEEVTG